LLQALNLELLLLNHLFQLGIARLQQLQLVLRLFKLNSYLALALQVILVAAFDSLVVVLILLKLLLQLSVSVNGKLQLLVLLVQNLKSVLMVLL
jgi:hypothetical protein